MARPAEVDAFRAAYRGTEIPPRYSGRAHLAFTSVATLAVVGGCLAQLSAVSAWEWLALPAVFLYANLAEYWGHRGPMHRPWRGLRSIYTRHTLQHHRFFTREAMAFDGPRDYRAVLFPPLLILFFLGAMALPMWLLLYLFASPNVAWLSVATGFAYFLNYEWLHFAYHCEPASRVGRLPGVQRLRRLHRVHHDPQLMSRCNFNITYPIGDWLFGTRHRQAPRRMPTTTDLRRIRERLAEVESQLAFHDALSQQLNEVVARQDREIAELQRHIAELSARLAELRGSRSGPDTDPGQEVPPHY